MGIYNSNMDKAEKIDRLNKEIELVKNKMHTLGHGAHGEYEGGGDGLHDEGWRMMRTKWQVYEAHLKTLRQEKQKLLRGK